MKPTNYAEKIRRRKQLLKENRVEPTTKKRQITLLLIFAGTVFLIGIIVLSLVYETVLLPTSLVIIISLMTVIWFIPKIYVKSLHNEPLNNNQTKFDREKERLKLEDDTRKTFAQIVGGAIFLFGLLFTYNTFVLNREGQVTDRFSKAVSQLGDEEIAVRLGGLYALERVAKDSPKDHWMIMEIISSYVREKSPKYVLSKIFEIADLKKDSTQDKQTGYEKIKTDIQAALTIIGRRISKQDTPHGNRIDLSNTHLRDADFRWADLINIDLTLADLHDADFSWAGLSYTDFRGADLRGANLEKANLYLTDFRNADLSFAKNLTFEQLEKAIINDGTKLPVDLESRRQELLNSSGRNLKELQRMTQ